MAPKYPFIDALRGYAVLLVITSHTGGMFLDLPYPLKKLTNFGWNGVQLFFLMSCVTLLLSWQSDEAKGRTDVIAFWIRRFFRIAPLYYLAALVYFLIETPPTGFDLGQLLASLAFVNAWHPTLIPTTPDGWTVVPGGWSIGVEFTFYALFPLQAIFVRSMRGAVVFVVLSLLIGCIANLLAYPQLVSSYGETAAARFLSFWFPNQLSIFALGTVLFFGLRKALDAPQAKLPMLLRKHATKIVLACIAGCIATANLPFPGRLPFALPLVVPSFLVASLIFMVFAFTMGNAPDSRFVNQPIRSLGKVSFSAYLIHFAILHKLPVLFPAVFDRHTTGWSAILTCVALWLAAVPLTYGISLITYHAIEEPMIGVGRRLIKARRRIVTPPVASLS